MAHLSGFARTGIRSKGDETGRLGQGEPVKYWDIVADKFGAAGWSWSYCSAVTEDSGSLMHIKPVDLTCCQPDFDVQASFLNRCRQLPRPSRPNVNSNKVEAWSGTVTPGPPGPASTVRMAYVGW
jgi:hypothetical protein